ncbi:helix-turn-helix domain-containing protein [Hymenobacter coalescens]
MQNEIKRLSETIVAAKDADILYTVKDVSDRLKLCEKTILARIDDGRLSASNLGTYDKPQYRISKADLTAYYNMNRCR